MTLVNAGTLPVSTFAGDAVRIEASANLLDAARAMTQANVGIVVVGGEDRPVRGVLSERDVVRALAAGRDMATTFVAEVAQTDLAWCDSTATVSEVAEEMMERYVRHLLVEEEGCLIGVVSARDLLGAYVSADESPYE